MLSTDSLLQNLNCNHENQNSAPLKIILLFLTLLTAHSLLAQKKNEKFRLHIKKAVSEIKIDGIMDEQTWSDAEVAAGFFYGIADGYKLCKSENRSKNEL